MENLFIYFEVDEELGKGLKASIIHKKNLDWKLLELNYENALDILLNETKELLLDSI